MNKDQTKKQSAVQQPPKQQPKLQEDITDLFAEIKDQNEQNIYMRFYTQQEEYEYKPQQLFEITNKSKISLKLNKYINEVVSSLYILNGFVKDNSRSCALLQTGKQIYLKKKDLWIQFLKMEEFSMIKNAFQCLMEQHKDVLKFSIFIIANILLKLGINMSKLSMILVEKRHTSNYLSLPTLSVLFLQFLQFSLYLSKGIDKHDYQKIHDFVRQLPRITYIKICKYQNKQDLQLMQKGQQHFFSKRTRDDSGQKKQQVYRHKNIQYLQLYERERLSQYKHQTSYKYVYSQNLIKKYGIKAPYSFELLFLFRYIYFDMINDFKPDLIFFVQEYPNDQKVIQARVRGYLLTELMEKVGNRIFLMKQVGIYDSYELQEQQKIKKNQNKKVQMEQPSSQMMIQQSLQQEINSMEIEISNEYQINNKLNKNIPPLSKQRQRQLDLQHDQFVKTLQKAQEEQKKLKVIQSSNKQSQMFQPSSTFFEKMKYILLEDISYSSLSLIQRTSFEEVGFQSRRHKYQKQFAQNVKKSLQQKIVYWKQQNNEELHKKLKISLSNTETMLKAMKIMQTPQRVFCMYQPYYDYIYNLKLNKKQILLDSQSNVIKYLPQNEVYVHYAKGTIVIFIMNFESYKIIGRKFQQSQAESLATISSESEVQIKKQYTLVCQGQFSEQMRTKNSVYIAAGEYIYKAFGLKQNGEGGYIYRLNYELPQPKWQLVSKQCSIMQGNNNFVNIPIQRKIHGFGMHDQISDTIMFMGGYAVNCSNQQFISKNIYVLKRNQNRVFRFGKTTNQIFIGAKNGKDRIPLYPFVYGFPFTLKTQKLSEAVILNTNGYMDNLPNNNRILLTQFKFSDGKQLNKLGVIAQRRMQYIKKSEKPEESDDVDEQAICNRDQLLHYMNQSSKLTNRYQNRCIFQTLQQGPILLSINTQKMNQKLAYLVVIKSSNEQISQFDQIHLRFNPNC